MTHGICLENGNFSLESPYKALDNLYPLMYAAKYNDVLFIKTAIETLTLEEKAKLINLTNKSGLTALHFAALYHSKDSLALLLAHNASLEIPSSLGYYPIHLLFDKASKENSIVELWDLFIKEDQIPNQTINTGDTLAHLAANTDQVQILIKINNSDRKLLNKKNNLLLTPLMFAVKNNQLMATLFLLNNSDLTLKNSHRETPLHLAAKHACLEVFKEVLPFFSIDALDEGHNSALTILIKNHKTEHLALLLTKKTNLDSELKGLYPIHLAVMSLNITCVTLILESAPGTLNKLNSKGETPLDTLKEMTIKPNVKEVYLLMEDFIQEKGGKLSCQLPQLTH